MSEPFVNEFIDDYYAECEEYLATSRRVLLAFEEAPDEPPRGDLTAQLARALHTLKGLSGMVGFADVESVAHLLEDWMRAGVSKAEPITITTLEGLFDGVKLIDNCLAAHRAGSEGPDIDAFAARVRALERGAESKPKELEAPVVKPGSPLATAILEGARLHDFLFVPTRDLAARGIGVETVRAQLTELGVIVHAAPQMLPEGIAFRFVVSLNNEVASVPPVMEGVTSFAFVPPSTASATAGSASGNGVTDRYAAAEQPATSSSVVRVELGRLDELMRLVGELVISRARVDDRIDGLERTTRGIAELRDASAVMQRQLRDLRDAIMHVRMVPIADAFDRMRYVAREAARETGRRVDVEISGASTEIDKLLVERMLEPLLHLIRNAVGHGIELPDARVAAGKPAEGLVSLRAYTAGERIVIEIEDDGAGVDEKAVESRARAMGLLELGREFETSSIMDILSAPGFSTREEVDLTSGRGVGMAVVRDRVRELGGEITLASEQSRGTCFTIKLPLTLMIVDAVMFRMDGHLMAAPQPGINEVLQVDQKDLTTFENNEVTQYRDGVLPVFRLRSLFGLAAEPEARDTHHVLVVGDAEAPVGIVVDRIIGQREIVVRSMTDPLVNVPGISGATELSDGTVALIVDTTQLARRVNAR